MSDYDDTNRGALFKNDKEGNEKRPDYKGPLNVNGQDWQIAAWLKTSKNGKKYMAVSIGPKMKSAEEPDAGEVAYDDSIPF